MVSLVNTSLPEAKIFEFDGDAVSRLSLDGAEAALSKFEPSAVAEFGQAAILHAADRTFHSLSVGVPIDPFEHALKTVPVFMKGKLGLATDPASPDNVVPFRPGQAPRAPRGLRLINGNQLRTTTKASPWFYVDRVIQGRKVSLLMGEDGSGKSFLMLLLAVATATGCEWLGFKVKQGPVIFLTAEEEKQDVWDRIEAIEKMLGGANLDLKDFHLVVIDDDDDSDDSLVLGERGEGGKIQMTELWHAIEREVERVKPVAVLLDPLVEIFDGDEMVRVQARQFVAPMRKLARKRNLAVYVSGHPSKTSAREKTGTAGTTGWSATMRGRQFYEIVYDADNNDTGERRLHVKKVTGGKAGMVVDVKLNDDGVPVRKSAPVVEGEPFDMAASVAGIERDKQDFLAKVDEFEEQGRSLSASPRAANYAPKFIAKADGGRDRVKRAAELERIMNDLFAEKRLFAVVDGYPSDNKKKLSRVPEKASKTPEKDSSPIANGDSPESRSP